MKQRASPFDAAQEAIEHTRRALFPFRLERWLLLGLVAFLDQCGRGGAGIPNLPGGGFPGSPGHSGAGAAEATAWLGSHIGLVMAIAALIMLFVVALSAFTLWVNSRGIFMYIEAVAAAPAELGLRWSEHAERAQSLFAWRFGLAMAIFMAVILIVGAGGGAVLLHTRDSLSGVATGILVGGLLLLLLAVIIAASIVSVLLRDFVAPLQFRLGLPCGEAARRAMALLRPQLGALALYLLLKIAFVIVLGVAALLAGCLTCCCAFLPVVCQATLQPLYFFERAWSLFLLRQLGVDVFAPMNSGTAIP
jgi:hypothetical protein